MPPRPGKIRRARMGPRFLEAANQQPRFFRDAEDILGHPQFYLPGANNQHENQNNPSSSQVDADAAQRRAQPPVPGHWEAPCPPPPPPTSTSGPPPVELPPSANPPLERSFEFPAFHLTTPPSPPRTVSPPFEHPSMLLNPNTVPLQVVPRTGSREPGHVFQPAPHRPIYLPIAPANLPTTSSNLSMTSNEPPAAPTTAGSDSKPVDQADNSPFALRVIIEDNPVLRKYIEDNPYYITSYADAKAFAQFHGYLDPDLLYPNVEEPTFDQCVKERFSCTAEQGWISDIIKSDYWLTDIYNSGLLQIRAPHEWRSDVHVWLSRTAGVIVLQRLRYAIVQDPFLYDGKRCAPSFIWIVLFIRHVLVLLPYAQHFGILDRLGEKKLDPCDTAFDFFALSRVIVELIDMIVTHKGVTLSKLPVVQTKVLSICDNCHLHIAMAGTAVQFNAEIVLSGLDRSNHADGFRTCFMNILQEFDVDGIASLVVARCTHPPAFFF
ncbi:hypothetical protein AGABI1DRAFT_131154 [Agaricus bisporus var. burnettii JB137-S8]|uniref:Uncharacterized protein n=1 Tax=Agaricus bisporus var. burnettii (strain JB137-S8 / ATCC MYA-4627 / FGSC 10392) TaxID=597362 RepID=K5XPH8_AGABU|nr:uncharacterized protein AGABI1DRAFT_131154 [Agaricus bisporus var. burnettii JB137-S8]EKM76600.1 hypothetical protein AGABI1DRAFT_131154 [Agaricus bisporus var. burnettii JB137-S8]